MYEGVGIKKLKLGTESMGAKVLGGGGQDEEKPSAGRTEIRHSIILQGKKLLVWEVTG